MLRHCFLSFVLSPFLLVAVPAQTSAPVAQPKTAVAAPKSAAVAALEEVEVARVVDGDTIHVRRRGEIEKLRLLSVDTEERLGNGGQGSATKPQTVFGEECALWAQKFFAGLAKEGEPTRVRLLFPGGVEKRDVYGRLLCHVVLPDGEDYQVMLVRIGKSPYFNKYGNSTVDHAAFVAAQEAAQAAKIGIWDPRANEPRTPGAPAAKRPYRELLSWWDARASAIDAFRARLAAKPDEVVDCEDPAALARAAAADREVLVFGEIDRLFDEKNGDQTVLMRSGAKGKELRVKIPAVLRKKHEELRLDERRQEFRQNYVWIRGRVRATERGFDLLGDDPSRWKPGGPEPALPPPAPVPAREPAK